MRNVVLTGFMGCGKSTVGQMLAERLGCRYADLDALIVSREGASINNIFARHGESYFRQAETETIRGIVALNGLVVSTGGGAVISPLNRELLHAAGVVINLTADITTITARLESDTDRPLLREGRSAERLAALLAEREAMYADADLRIDTTGKSVEDVVAEVISFLEAKG
ncbi:shikimate kinase [Geobacter pickeringii]|uniref:Shikimate kinase n=1 Tax=Geobacter pickeringii TaxID=345632 RepID=A0A0B5BEE9_9BACT|nr:shikimate kinase [Geobacter pickeringii]AJE02905.1 shikimate kinase [Geobacter pickeringii]